MEKGKITPVVEKIRMQIDALEYFAKLSDYGRKRNCILLESADKIKKYGEKSIVCVDPCLNVRGIGEKFEITALNETGKKFMKHIRDDLDFCDSVKVADFKITGILKPKRGNVSEEERLKLKTHADILRAIAFKLAPETQVEYPFAGLFGAISYDFIDQFEDLPPNKKDVLKEPDYEMNFYDSVFLVDHPAKEVMIIANKLLFESSDGAAEQKRAEETIEKYKKALDAEMPTKRHFRKTKVRLESDTTKNDFIKIVKRLKQNVLNGDVVQVVPSRTTIANYSAEPLDIYRELRELNPSPYMFYFCHSDGVLLGSSPEMCIRVQGKERKTIEISPIAGTKPRGILNGKIDADLDSKYETELKLDEKELAEHTMLIDLARNDIARVSDPGSRSCDSPFMIEKYSHVQHIVSHVKGTLRKEYDCLHAYLASMNMGTLTGAPKIKAMELIRKKEKTKRGFYGGSIGYLTPSGNFDSAIVIRSMSLKNGKAYVRAGAGVVHDSIPENEFAETERKAAAAIKAIKIASEAGFSPGFSAEKAASGDKGDLDD